MSVKIDMEMPKSCSVCDFCSYNEGTLEDYYICVASGEYLGTTASEKKRHKKCPLKEVK